jgi:uncharacterized caspase-like protein
MPDRSRRSWCAAALVAAASAVLGEATAQVPAGSGRRVALVIGNGAYRGAALKNPVHDAAAVAEQLGILGFEVALHTDLALREMVEALRRFSLDARGAAVRLVFYAGHGVQHRGRNYLLPVDAEIRSEDDLPARSADLDGLLDRLGANRDGINIVILDACRNNPFSGGEIVGPDGRRLKFRGSMPPGLAPVDAPTGSLVAFSTSPGGVALDNPQASTSLYTRHLLAAMQVPGLPIELLFKQVRMAVARETGRVQVPWESSSLTGDFCFRTGAGGACRAER